MLCMLPVSAERSKSSSYGIPQYFVAYVLYTAYLANGILPTRSCRLGVKLSAMLPWQRLSLISASMSPFPEEPLNLSPSEGGGHYPAEIHQKLNGDKYKIIRKLGYGPRSSTWLVLRVHDPGHFAVKIFTVPASERAKSVELPIIKEVDKISRSGSLELPTFHGSFWEESSAGSHICFVMNPLSTSVKILQRDAENQQLPVHVVQRILLSVSSSLNGLHNANIMHGRTCLIN